MAQKILIRRGGINYINAGSTVAVTAGELVYASGSIASSTVENVVFIANATGNNTFVAVGRLHTGTLSATSFDSRLNGLPYYHTTNKALYRLGNGTPLDLGGNLGSVSASYIADDTTTMSHIVTSQPVTFTTASNHGFGFTLNDGTNSIILQTPQALTTTSNVTFANITGSNLLLSGNANIDGDIILGGNITIGNQNTDNISLGGEFTSNLIPDADDTYNVGSPSRRWRLYGVNSEITGSFKGTFSGTFAGDLFTVTGNAGSSIISSGDTLAFVTASNHGFSLTVSGDSVSLATPQDLRTTASPTFAGATLDAIQVGITGANEIDTTSGNLTIDSAGGTVTVDDNLTVTGATITLSNVPTGTDNTILVLNSSNQVVTDEIDSRVFGSTLIDGSGSATQVAFWSDANTLVGDAGMTYNSSTDVLSVGSSTFGTDVSIAGNLTVAGTQTTIDSTRVNIGDNIIVLNTAGTVADGGVQVVDTTGAAGTGSLLWNATSDYWYAGVSGSTHYRVTTYNSATPTTNVIPKVDANKRLVDSTLTDNGTSIAISGLSANSFVHTNATKYLSTVTPSVSGDLFQWNGSAFIASNVIDGGTY